MMVMTVELESCNCKTPKPALTPSADFSVKTIIIVKYHDSILY